MITGPAMSECNLLPADHYSFNEQLSIDNGLYKVNAIGEIAAGTSESQGSITITDTLFLSQQHSAFHIY